MTLTAKELEKIADLAYLDNESGDSQLAADISEIMDLVEQLRAVDTKGIAPLYHPFDLHQRFRADSVTEDSCLKELEEIAPQFDEGMYLVPKVIESGH